MRPGTPGFRGERLRIAREARGISSALLSEQIGVSRAAITQYEKGNQSPSPMVLKLISDKLNLPIHHFLRPVANNDEEVIFYRSLSSTTKNARIIAHQRYTWFREIVSFLRRYIKFPKANILEFDIPTDKLVEIRDQDIEELALRTRNYWGINEAPIGNVALILEKNGIILARHELNSDKLDAFSEWNVNDLNPYIILNSQKGSAVRSRFDAAHELGHLILHKNIPIKMLNSRQIFSVIEDQANRFGAAFLLPEKTFTSDLHSITLDSLRSLKTKWRASVGVMIKRLRNLDILSQDEERNLWINYSRRGWRKCEPLDDQLETELPRFVRRSIELLIERNIVLREEIPFQLALLPSDIEDLVGLPNKYFENEELKIEIENQNMPNIIRFPNN